MKTKILLQLRNFLLTAAILPLLVGLLVLFSGMGAI
jgi:hypothetical protein